MGGLTEKMTSGVKFIFKTLTKIPIIIVITYAIFNAFAFGLTYFKLLGFSYVVMQTAVENNYLPPQELNTLNKYLDSIADTGVIDNAKIVTKDENGSEKDATERRQYGVPVTVGVSAHYKFIWPLTPREQLSNKNEQFIGMSDNTAFSGFADDGTLQSRREEYENNEKNNIKIVYTVPGLKYYPDMN